jgi:protein TonB
MRVVDSISVVFLLAALGVNAASADTALPASSAPPFIDVKSPPPDITPPKWDGSSHANPEYPKAARRYSEQGIAHITFTVLEDGSVIAPSITTSSGFADLDAAALEAVKTWRYQPAMKDGKPIAVRIETYIRFSLGR